jgi:anti-anti-sigma factor
MWNQRHGEERNQGGVAVEDLRLADGRRAVEVPPEGAVGRPGLRVRAIERTVLVRFADAEILFEEEAVNMVGQDLRRLIEEQDLGRLVVNFAGVRYISSEVLGILAGLQRQLEPARGSVVLCGLDPLLRDMVRITGLDLVFDVCADEAEALGLILC